MRVYALRPDVILDPAPICRWVEAWTNAAHEPILFPLYDCEDFETVGDVTVDPERTMCFRQMIARLDQPAEKFLRWLALWINFVRRNQDGGNVIFTDLGVFPRFTPNKTAHIVTTRFVHTNPVLINNAIQRMFGVECRDEAWEGADRAKDDIDFFDRPTLYKRGEDILDRWVVMCDSPLPTLDQIKQAHEKAHAQG